MKKIISLAFILSMLDAGSASAAGLTQAQTVLTTLESDLQTIVPVAATITLMISGIMYAMRMIQKDTFVHWLFGCILVGSAPEVTSLIFG